MKLLKLKELWKEFNKKYFDGLLHEIPIRLTKSRKLYGYFRHSEGSLNSVIRISGPLNKSWEELSDTLLHEMVHQFLFEQTGDCDSEHGERFSLVANEVGLSSVSKETDILSGA